jgi:hypothetical protein
MPGFLRLGAVKVSVAASASLLTIRYHDLRANPASHVDHIIAFPGLHALEATPSGDGRLSGEGRHARRAGGPLDK